VIMMCQMMHAHSPELLHVPSVTQDPMPQQAIDPTATPGPTVNNSHESDPR
jgi:hypothetical protein